MENKKIFSIVELFASMTGVNFVGLREYSSDKSDNTEVANIRMNVGISYGNAKDADLKTLQNITDSEMREALAELQQKDSRVTFEILEAAIAEMKVSIIAPEKARSEGQEIRLFIFWQNIKIMSFSLYLLRIARLRKE